MQAKKNGSDDCKKMIASLHKSQRHRAYIPRRDWKASSRKNNGHDSCTERVRQSASERFVVL